MVAPQKVKKVEIDSRFDKMFKDKSFNVVSKVDKYGRRIKKEDKYALEKYYSKKDESEQEDDEEEGEAELSEESEQKPDDPSKKYYDEEGNFHW